MLWHFQEKLHNQENLVFGWCQRGFKLYQTPQTEVPLRCIWKARSECLMSSKRKEKKIKGTDTVPLPPPTEIANFSYTPQKSSKDQRCRHSQSPPKRLSHPPYPPALSAWPQSSFVTMEKGSPGVSNKIGPLAYDELSHVLQEVQGCPAKTAIYGISPKIVKNWRNRSFC